jgi:hypothetical protein
MAILVIVGTFLSLPKDSIFAHSIVSRSYQSSYSDAIAENLVLYYPFNDEPQGGIVEDHSGNGNHGIVQSDGPIFITDGKVGAGAYLFDGQDDYIFVQNNGSLNLGNQLTLAAWYNTTDPPGPSENQGPIITWNDELIPTSTGVHMWINTIGFQWGGLGTGANLIGTDDNDINYVISTEDQSIKTWHHLVVTYDGSTDTAKAYVDGILKNERILGMIPAIPQTNYPLFIGARGGFEPWFKGRLDEIRIYNRAISQAEVLELFEAETRVIYLPIILK